MRKFDLSKITKASFFEQFLVILAILLTLPVIQPFYSAFIMGAEQVVSAGIVTLLYVAIPLLIIGSLLSRKIFPLVVIVPAVYYLLYLNNLVVNYSPYVVVPTAIVSFIYIVLKGHVRSFGFVVLVVYSFVLYEWYSAAILSITFIFARFLALVVSHNYNIFNTLGLNKSLLHLGKSFLYWSPLLIIIIPVSRLQTNINEQITSEIYQLTPVDTLKYYHVNMLTDSLENLMEAKKGVSSIIYIDSINGRRKEVFKLKLPDIEKAHFALNNSDTFQLSLPVLGSMQYFVYNKLDLEMVNQNSSFIHEVLYDAYKENDTKLDTSINLSVNEFISGQTINNSLFNYENSKLLTFINKPKDSKEPYVLICKNINIPDPNYVNDNLNEDIEVSLAYLFVSFSNNIVKSLREDNMKFELPELSTGNLVNREAIDEKKRAVYKTIDNHKNRTWQKVNKEIDEVLPEPLLKTES
ncbi:MAG TPA: hypothetical protein VJ951_12000, partial [Bacteroidales bacterium]|nr:hypothetical protein [Bacteroidales bacterium]